MSGEGETEVQDRDYEAEARNLGWHPQEEFRGSPNDWVDAETFVRRGEQQLPIMRENNRKLAQRVRASDDKLAEMSTRMDEAMESLRALRSMAEKANEAGYQRALADLKAQQREAVRQGDEATFDKIEGEIAKVEATREEIAPKPAPTPADNQPKGPRATPEFTAWFAENKDWILADPVLGNAATRFDIQLKNADEDYTEAERWDKVKEMVQEKYPRRFANATGEDMPPRKEPEQENHQQPTAPNLRRAASVLTPSGGAPASSGKKGGIDSIQNPTERAEARKAFQSIRRSIPDYTEAEYMKVYVDPGADVIADSISRKVKANGSARA